MFKEYLVLIAVKSGLLKKEETKLSKLWVVKIAVKLGLLKRWTFNRQCTDEARQLGYRKSKRLFAEKRKFHKTILKERNPKKRSLLAVVYYNKIYVDTKNITPIDPDGKKKTFGFVPDFIEYEKDLFKDKIVIDIGCGSGISTEHISRYAKTVYGLEYASIIHEEAKRTYGNIKNVQFLSIDEIKLPFDDGSIDLAYSNDVIEHLHPDDAFMHLPEVLRVLKNGGRYYFWTPGKNSGPHDFTKNFYLRGVGVSPKASHIREYNFAEMIEILKEVGYRKVTIPDIKKEVLLIAEK